jgi:large subunit ribosomal protein L30
MAVKVTQIRSAIGVQVQHRGTLRSLGVGRIGRSAVHADSPSLRGQLHQVGYLLRVEEVED